MNKIKIDKIHNNVPPDYYNQGIDKNILQRYWHMKRFDAIIKILKQIDDKALDIGCHGGILTNEISAIINNNIYGIDISEKSIQYAQLKYPHINFKVADAEKKLPFENNAFGLIICFDVLEHLINIKRAISEIKRVLKNKGELIIGVPNENFLFKIIWYLWTRTKGKVWEGVHVQKFNNHLLNKIFANSGFQEIERKEMHLKMYWIIKYKLIK